MQLKKITLTIFAAFTITLLLTPLAFALPDGAAVTNVGSGTEGALTDDTGTASGNAGWIYNLDLDAYSATNYWAGIWGNVSGNVELRDGGGKIFFTQAMANPPKASGGQGVRTMVFAFNVADTVPNFGGLNTNLRTGAQTDTLTGVTGPLTDSATSLFTSQSFSKLVVGNQSLQNNVTSAAWCARMYNATSGALIDPACAYMTVSLNDGSNNLLFASQAVNPYAVNGVTPVRIFDNVTVAHYQMILYVNNSGQSIAQNYEMFLELR
jgi:hypothetical protein